MGTTLRFAVLVLVMVVATIGMVNSMFALSPWDDKEILCKFAAGFDPNLRMADSMRLDLRGLRELKDCAPAGAVVKNLPGIVGAVLVLLSAAALYAWLPRWKSRRGRVIPLDEADPDGELRAELMRLVATARLRTVPAFVVDPASFDAGAVVFGRAGRHTVCLHAGLLAAWRGNADGRAGFHAVVLHELAHLRNRDVDLAYAVTALWRVFLALVVVPFTVLYGGSFVAAQFFGAFYGGDAVFWPAGRAGVLRALASALFMVLLVVLARADTLRHRELYADADAVALGAQRQVWDGARDRGPLTVVPTFLHQARSRVTALWSTHPSWAVRRRSLDDPAALFSLGTEQMFLIGWAALVSAHTLSGLWGTTAATWATALPTAVLVTIAVWRSLAYAEHHGLRRPDGLRPGLALGLGLACGELMTGITSGAGWLPEHPEILLVLPAGAVLFTLWTVACARLRLRTLGGASLRRAIWPALLASCLLAAAGVNWWLRFGFLYLAGDILTGAGLQQQMIQSFPGPWSEHTTELDWFTATMPQAAMLGTSTLFAGATMVLWAFPLALWLRRTRVYGPAAGLRSAVTAGLLGGVVCLAGLVGVMAHMHTWQPPLGASNGTFSMLYLWWAATAIWAGVALTGAVVAVTSRYRWLPRALVAAGVAQSVALVGKFALGSVDGCLGPLRTLAHTCHWVPGPSWLITQPLAGLVLPSVLGAALVAVAARGAAAALRLRAPARQPRPAPAAPSIPVRPSRRRSLVTLGGLALLIAVAAVGPVAVAGQQRAEAQTPSAMTPPPPPRASERIRTLQLLAWYTLSGKRDIRQLTAHYGEFRKQLDSVVQAAQSRPHELVRFDSHRLRRTCAALTTDATTARRLPIPDRDLRAPWSSWLRTTLDASRTCVRLVDGNRNDPRENDIMLKGLVQGYTRSATAVGPVVRQVEAATRLWPQWAHTGKGR
ncbi:M48 family metalloprotease [Streptomyces decoyicus]|uniref:M48 family metalloprotease n=1 Tax=Streptomyces decoyicus TaxID=249567 RepID=UPI002E185C20|nr:M48 family metalloprotease [Streptomyces decoyicus]